MQWHRDWRNVAMVVACCIPFLGFWATGLTDLDEGFYGAVVAHMLRTGDWITPHFNGAPWFEKPILLYWMAAPSIALFGEHVGPRLPSIVCTLLTGLVLFRFLRRHFSVDFARVAVSAYLGSLLVVGVGRLMITDAPFVLAMTVALLTFYESLTGRPSLRTWSAVALGFAVLAKGPVAGLFFLLIAGVVFWRMPDLRSGFKGHWIAGIALFCLVVGAWYVPAYLANGDVFVQKFLIEQNLGRFQGGDLAHRTPVWAIPLYFPAVLFLALLPWSVWALKGKWFEWPTDPLRRYLWIWSLVVLIFFSISLTKLPHYILPAVLPFTVLTVLAVVERRPDKPGTDFWLKCALAWSAIVFSLATPVFTLDYNSRFSDVHKVARFLREKQGRVVLFDVGRQERDTSIKLTINQSAHPSFLFYLRREGQMSDDPADILESKDQVWIVTEAGDMTTELSESIVFGGFTLEQVQLPFETEKYDVWLAEPLVVEPLTAPLE